MYAIIETGGKQYKVQQGDVISIEKLEIEEGGAVVFDRVLAISSETGFTVGAPLIAGATVEATVEKQGRGKKIRIFTYKPKKNYHRRKGHRQSFTQVVIGAIKA